ncbi:MAG: hypothetical protein QNJ98_15690 [Planctomycetota bacterium]|nr:hypothetical protein [Planctomycetota bacterium]
MHRFVVLPLVILLAAPAAWAKDPSPAEALRMRLEASRKDDDAAEWIVALKELASTYARATKKERPKLMREAGRAFEGGSVVVKQTALKAILDTEDGDVAWKEALRRVFPKVEAETPGTWDVEVLKAVYVLRPDGAIDPLLKLMKKAKSPQLAAGGLRVLGAYERSKKRVYVLKELAEIVVANAPGRSRKGSRGSDRFWAMATQLEATLNELTGQSFKLKDWGPVWKENKKHPERLFKNPLPKS